MCFRSIQHFFKLTTRSKHISNPARRRLLQAGALVFAGATAGLSHAAQSPPERRLSFSSLHTGESLNVSYWTEGKYQADALAEVNHILRDWRVDEIFPIKTDLLDLLFDLQNNLHNNRSIEIISAYRSPSTNHALRKVSNGGVAKKSLHMQGMAIDIRIPGCKLSDVRRTAIAMRRGGVGYYPNSGFVHVDIGRVRRWG